MEYVARHECGSLPRRPKLPAVAQIKREIYIRKPPRNLEYKRKDKNTDAKYPSAEGLVPPKNGKLKFAQIFRQ